MAADNYFVISASEDGDIRVRRFSKQELEDKLKESWWGDSPKFLDVDSDLERESGLLIIRGERVAPKPVYVVKAWEV